MPSWGAGARRPSCRTWPPRSRFHSPGPPDHALGPRGPGLRGRDRPVGGRPDARLADPAHGRRGHRPAAVRRGAVRPLEPPAAADPPSPVGHAGPARAARAHRARDREPVPGADLLPADRGSPPVPARSLGAAGGHLAPRPSPAGVRYSIAPHQRGRYVLGPLTADLSDPFALTKLRVEFDERDELVVAPEVELLGSGPDSPFGMTSGLALAKHLFRTGDEFYTMRAYVEGDDLRRIHWPSVARSGELMIRQDESTRRSTAVLFIDTRDSVVGQTHTPSFEKVISAAASLGILLMRYGFSVKLATTQMPPQRVG